MQLTLWIVLLVTAIVSSAISLSVGMTRASDTAVQVSMVSAAGSGVFWLLSMVGAFRVETISNGSVITRSYPGVATLGVVGLGLAVLVIYRGSIEVLQ
jgi:hypothetical protein